MAPKPKKPNAFMIFCNKYRHQMISRSGVDMSLKEAIDLAGPLWSKMPDEEKEKYKEKAKSAAKHTPHAIKMAETKKVEEATKKYELKVYDNITSTLHCMSAVGSLQYFNVCILHVNTFCYDEKEKRHYPAEIAVVKFNLKQGVWDEYHAICTPGPFPLGYAATVQTKADETHQLPVPDPSAPSNIDKIFHELIAFVDDKSRNKPSPLYVPPNNFTEAKELLATLCTDHGYDPLYLEVHSLTQLFYQMRNAAAGKAVYHSETPATKEIERDEFELAPAIACTIHDALGVPFKCSKSVVIRMAYVICKNCCPDLNIIPVPGKHIPDTSEKKPTPPPPVDVPILDPEVKIKQEQFSSDSESESEVEEDVPYMVNGVKIKQEKLSSESEDDDNGSIASEESEMKPPLIDVKETKVDVTAPSASAIVACSYDDDDYMFL